MATCAHGARAYTQPRESTTCFLRHARRSYKVPRLAFINKLDRQGANPFKVTRDLRNKLKLNAAMVQLPIGLEEKLAGIVDVIARKAYTFEGAYGGSGGGGNRVPDTAPVSVQIATNR
jgi:translation elongation factor EF-G